MAAICQSAKRRATATLGHQALLVFSCSLLLISCTRPPEKLFESARTESVRGRFSLARQYASEGYARFQSQPASEWHWKFKLLLAEMHLFNYDRRQAEALLTAAPPSAFPRLAPRYQELRGYVLLLRQQYDSGEQLLRAALTGAHSFGDYELEADIQLL